MSAIRKNRRCTITFTFANPESAMEWFEESQRNGLIQPMAGLFQEDGLDHLVGDSGAPGSNRLIVRRNTDRPKGQVKRESNISDRIVVT